MRIVAVRLRLIIVLAAVLCGEHLAHEARQQGHLLLQLKDLLLGRFQLAEGPVVADKVLKVLVEVGEQLEGKQVGRVDAQLLQLPLQLQQAAAEKVEYFGAEQSVEGDLDERRDDARLVGEVL